MLQRLISQLVLGGGSLAFATSFNRSEYVAMRQSLMARNEDRAFDASITLSAAEELVDQQLVAMRDEYVVRTKADGSFAPATYFHKWNLTSVRAEPLFEFLEKLPKGGNLHLHSGSFGSIDWVLTEGLAMEGCHVFWREDNDEYLKGTFGFWRTEAPRGFEPCDGVLAREPAFRRQLRSLLTSNESLADVDSTRAWYAFNHIFQRLGPGMSHRPLLLKYLESTFEGALRNAVSHLEIRVLCGADSLGALTDLDGNTYNGSAIVTTYQEALRAFRASSPDRAHFSLKLIVSSSRSRPQAQIKRDLELALSLRKLYPDFVVGWDAVSEEGPGHPSLDYLDAFLHTSVKGEEIGVDLPLLLHDGESQDRNNSNVADAVLLQCPRIGHGFNTGTFFPEVREEMKRRGTVLEVNPISNQVLRYVGSLESHPAAALAFDGVRIVIASDDPGVFGYEGLTLDWWAVTTAWRLNLKSLKALALNSLRYSSLIGSQKEAAIERWQKDWASFVSGSFAANDGSPLVV